MKSMTNKVEPQPDSEINCNNCEASCCRLEAVLIDDTEVPDKFIEVDARGRWKMAQLEDGWCSALDRNTMRCTIYEKRPWVCREFAMGGKECIAARAATVKIAYSV